MLLAQPPAEPLRGVVVYGTIGFADRTQSEVVRPSPQLAVQAANHLFFVQQRLASARVLAKAVAEPTDLLAHRSRADEGASRTRRVTAAERIAQEVERLIGNAT